jgi:hypothetical protein
MHNGDVMHANSYVISKIAEYILPKVCVREVCIKSHQASKTVSYKAKNPTLCEAQTAS